MIIENDDGVMTMWSDDKYFRGKMKGFKNTEDAQMMVENEMDKRSENGYVVKQTDADGKLSMVLREIKFNISAPK